MPLQGGGRASPFFLQFGVKKVVVWCIYTFARRGKSFPLILQSRAKKVAMWCIYPFTKRRKSFQLFFAIWRKKKLRFDASTPLQRGGRASPPFLQLFLKKVAAWCNYILAKLGGVFPLFCAIIKKKLQRDAGASHIVESNPRHIVEQTLWRKNYKTSHWQILIVRAVTSSIFFLAKAVTSANFLNVRCPWLQQPLLYVCPCGSWPFKSAVKKFYKSGTKVNIKIMFKFFKMTGILQSRNLVEITKKF